MLAPTAAHAFILKYEGAFERAGEGFHYPEFDCVVGADLIADQAGPVLFPGDAPGL